MNSIYTSLCSRVCQQNYTSIEPNKTQYILPHLITSHYDVICP